MRQILLDMDGVLADFVAGVVAASGRPNPYDNPDSFGCFDMERLWGITAEEFWKPTNSTEFWASLPLTPDAKEIVALAADVVGVNNVAILTAPSQHPGCFIGKRLWIERNFPQFKRRIIFGSAKGFMAAPDRLLIDDRDRNVEEYSKAGGPAFLLPRPWNKSWADAEIAVELMGAYIAAASLREFLKK